MANKWKYEVDCRNCTLVQFVDEPEHHRYDEYCIATLAGKKTIHADDDYVVRCDCFTQKEEQLSLF